MTLYDYEFDPSKYTDWRLPENRIEAFKRIYDVRLREGDLDHHHAGKVICDVMKLTDEQRAWYSMIFGQSYRNHVAMIAMQHNLIDMNEKQLIAWHDKNWNRLKYAKDTKWNLRKLPQFILDVKSKIGSGGLYEYLGNAAAKATTEKNYYSLNDTLKNFYSMGRMTAWLAQQTLYEFFGWDIDHWDQQLYDGATWSQYDSLCYIFNRLDIARTQQARDFRFFEYKPTRQDIALMEKNTEILMDTLNKELPYHVDIYNVESVECEFRKTAYGPRKIKEFTFWTSNELAEEFETLYNLWPDANWMPYVIALMTKGPNVREYGYSKDYFRVFNGYGLNLNTHYYYEDEPDAHKLLNLPKHKSNSVFMLERLWNDKFNKNEQLDLRRQYRPTRFIQWNDPTHDVYELVNTK